MEIILGVFVSGIIQFVKNKFALSEYATLAVLALIALAAAGIYTWLMAAGYWNSVYQILVTAGAFYAFILQRFEK